jgi:hypothetical protein
MTRFTALWKASPRKMLLAYRPTDGGGYVHAGAHGCRRHGRLAGALGETDPGRLSRQRHGGRRARPSGCRDEGRGQLVSDKLITRWPD